MCFLYLILFWLGSVSTNVSGDKTTLMTEVKNTWGCFYSEREFLILDHDVDDLFMGVISFNSVMTAKRSEINKSWISEVLKYLRKYCWIYQDVAPEDELLEIWGGCISYQWIRTVWNVYTLLQFPWITYKATISLSPMDQYFFSLSIWRVYECHR